VFDEAVARGVEVMPLSAFCFERGAPSVNGLMLGFAAVPPDLLDAGMKRLVSAIEAVRQAGRPSRPRRPARP
jgi:DNA-binding transcriptional MocR family regulator